MTRLIIDNREAILGSDFNIKMAFENPYFTKTSNYSLEIDIPMPINNHIFSNLNRMDVTKEKKIYPAKLYVDNRKILDGSAVLLSVENLLIKIQLIAGNAEFNFLTNDEVYIDELDLGSIQYYVPIKGTADDKSNIFSAENDYVLARVKIGDEIRNLFYFTKDNGFYITTRDNEWSYPQPYLRTIIRKIVELYGYSLGESYIESTWMRYLYIVSWFRKSRDGNNLKRCLPHWTLSEFFNKLEKFAGVITVVDENTKTVNLIDINTYFNNSLIYIKNIVDAYETKINNETIKEDITKGNTEYKLPAKTDNGYNRLHDDVIAASNSYVGESYQDILSTWEADEDTAKKSRIYRAKNRLYINYVVDGSDTLKEVDIYGNLIRDESTSDIDNSIEIIPANIEKVDIGLWQLDERGTRVDKVDSLYINVPVSSYNPGFGRSTITNIQEYIDGEESIEINRDKKDILELAIYTGLKSISCGDYGTISIPSAFIDCRQQPEKQIGSNEEYSLSLKDVCSNSMGYRHKSLTLINSDVEYNISFIANVIPDIRKTFIINNKKYFAKKMEVNITAKGMDKIIEGTFYRIE